ncbi:hypothetical protein [Hoeflea sp.]|uniref:hypothetical protein n=1 Tax=Hoeflea sp. TaxID=1940281 RepID=UPI003B529712
MQFNVVSNAAAFRKGVRQVRNDVRFAQAKALTATARELVNVSNRHTVRAFDRPTRFTQNSAGMRWATKQNLKARVFIKSIQAGYLELEETGGVRKPKRQFLPVPANARRNKFGNMGRRQLATMLARPDHFIAEINGTVGVWKRERRGGLKLMVTFTPTAKYEKRFNWRRTMERNARRLFPDFYARELDRVFRR